MAPEAQFSCAVDEKDHDEKKEKLRQFYFVKFNSTFVDPAAKVTIARAKNLIQRLEKQKEHILSVRESIWGTLAPEERRLEECYYPSGYERTIKDLQCLLKKHWPESNDEDPEEVVDPKLELINIKEKTQTLNYQLAHGRNNLAEEKRIIRELEYLKVRKEKLDADIKEGEAKKVWYWGSKHDIQRRIREYLKIVRDYPACREAVVRRYETKKANINQETAPLEERLCIIEEKQNRAVQDKRAAKSQVLEQTDCYDDYVAILNKAKELAAKKDLVALEELSREQVETFMSRWSDDEFRTNYQRSITPSLANRNLNTDGTTLNPVEKPTTPAGKRFRWKTKPPPS